MFGAVTLDQLRMLVTVEETGSFSAAGRKLSRVQSAISQAIRTLETTQQVNLFDRSSRLPCLTEAGRVLVAHARQVLEQAELFERTAGAIAAGMEAELTIALDGMVPTDPMIRSLAGLQRAFPDLSVTLYTEAAWGGERRVRDGGAMLAVCPLLPAGAQDLQAYRLASMALIPVAAPDHPLSREIRPLSREVLAEHVQLILTNPFDPASASHSVVGPRVWRFVDLARRLEFMLAGFGWGNMPEHLVRDHLATGRLVSLPIDDPYVLAGSMTLHVVHNRTRPLGLATRWLLDDLRGKAW